MSPERQSFDRREYHLVYGLPLAGTLLGAAAGYGLAMSDTVTGWLRGLGGPIAGPLMASADNLALFTGLAGLTACYLVSAWWARRRRAAPVGPGAGPGAGPLHSKPDQP